jgi:hypothetical protein
VDFDRSGRLVTTSYDGFVRIYAAEHYDKPREHICGQYVVPILQGRRGLLLELQQARERAPRPHEVFGAVQATSDRLDILINNAGIGTASPRQTSAEEFETEPWPVGNFRRRPGHRDPSG